MKKRERLYKNNLVNLKDIITESVCFYNLEKPEVSAVIFTLMLIYGIIAIAIDEASLILGIASRLLVNSYLGLAYMYTCILQYRNINKNFSQILFHTLRKYPLLLLSILFSCSVIFGGIVLFVVPGIVAAVMLLFVQCHILEGAPLIKSVKNSTEQVKGNINRIIFLLFSLVSIALVPLIILFSLMYFKKTAIVIYLISSVLVIFDLVRLKMTSLLYTKLIY